MASDKRCHYEVLGLSRDCTSDEIRSAYKKLALQRHPDKLVQSGLSQAEATAQFQELAHAYEVLSDPKERAWYDSHRSQILFSDPNSVNSGSHSFVPNLFSFFSNTVYSGYGDTGKGFYKVYSDVFNKIYANEIMFCKKLGLGLENVGNTPEMGNLQSPYEQVTAFYNYWMGFSTVMDFFWVDQYDVMAGPNRKSRRLMEEENKKLRKKARREYNETVRGLAEFVKKRDKRVIDMMVKKNAEMEKRKGEERERKKKLEQERMERMKAYEEPEWAKVDEEDVEEIWELEEEKEKGNGRKEELYCVVCGKKFKSEKQWKNHEQSKKHKEKVAELRHAFQEEDEEEVEDLEGVNEIEEKFKKEAGITDEVDDLELSDEEDVFVDAKGGDEVARDGNSSDDADGEESVLETMVSGHKSRRMTEDLPAEVPVKDEDEEVEFMQYDNGKSRRRKGRKQKGNSNSEEAMKSDIDDTNPQNEHHDKPLEEEASSHSVLENDSDDYMGKSHKSSNQYNKKGGTKKETNTKQKNSSKGKKGKATSKNSGSMCQTCGEEFESRNKLHKHLGDTGHAALKSR